MSPPGSVGAKERDYWFTVLAVDPIALPLVRSFARRGSPSPDAISWWSLLLGLPVGAAFAAGTRWGLVLGALLWYVSFVFDCVDGKLARATGRTSKRGALLDRMGDGARRGSSVLGLYWFVLNEHGTGWAWWVVLFGIGAFYVIEISGGEGGEERGEPQGLAARLARYRLLPHPGMTDVSALVFVLGPLAGLVLPALIAGLTITFAAILRNFLRAVTA